jgi:dynein heavy chain
MTPLLVLLGDAADPTTALFAVAKKRGAEMVRVSFTQSQTHEATNAVDAAQKHGHWVLLENCNMVPSWTPMLEVMVQSLTTMQNVNQDFRLLLSTRPFEGFSIAVLHRSVRVVVETSRGIRATCASLMSVESDIDQRAWEDVASAIGAKPSYGLLFRLVLFHSVLQERRKFGPAGFNAAYHFNLNDFSTAQTAVQQYISSVVETKADPADGTEGEVLGRTIKSIQHLIGSVVYGGHVTDIWDQRCIEATMCSMFHVPSMGSDDDVFDSIGINTLSNVELPGNFDECRDAVNSLPYDEQPDLFGMHCSSTRYWIHTQGTAASDLLKLVHSKKRTQSKASGHTTSEDTATQSAALKLLHALPVNLPKEGRFRFRNHDSTHITILQETTKFNNLLNCMRDSLHYLCNALLGKIVMTEAHDVMSTALVAGTVPTAWRDLSFESTKSLSAWFSELRLRVEYLSHWKDTGHPIVVALPVLYYPRAFLWTATQNYARKHFIALDNLSFKFEPHTHSSSKLEEEPRDGIFVAGFVLEGARWDAGSGALEDLAPEDFVSQAPAFHFIPTVNYKPNPLNFMCPMYHTSERSRLKSSNFIVAVEFRSHGNSLKWVLQGVALILDIDADGSEVGKFSSTSGGVTTD